MLNPEEKSEIQGLLRQVATVVRDNCPEDQYAQLKELWRKAADCPDTHDDHRLPRLAMRLDMAATFAGEVSAEGLVIASILPAWQKSKPLPPHTPWGTRRTTPACCWP